MDAQLDDVTRHLAYEALSSGSFRSTGGITLEEQGVRTDAVEHIYEAIRAETKRRMKIVEDVAIYAAGYGVGVVYASDLSEIWATPKLPALNAATYDPMVTKSKVVKETFPVFVTGEDHLEQVAERENRRVALLWRHGKFGSQAEAEV